uniref:2-oxoglutarate and iron-dependent oxygenase domain-containing protein n=1 Tax=Pacificoceanicola onchidii TaxID=2562685 RepID=UPI001F0F9706
MGALIAKQRGACSEGIEGLPLIDISGISTGSRHRLKAIADEIGLAARTVGFFRIIGHGIDLSLVERTYQMAERFFALPESIKRQYYIGLSSNHRG